MPRVELAGGFYNDSAVQFSAEECLNMKPAVDTYNSGKGNVKLVEHFGTEPIDSIKVTAISRIYTAYTASNKKTYTVFWGINSGDIDIINVITYNNSGADLDVAFPIGLNASRNFPDKIEVTENDSVLSILVVWENEEQKHILLFYNKTADTIAICITPQDTYFVQQTYKDTYFAFADRENGRFYISDNNAFDPLNCINALDFGTLESNPDKVNGIASIGNELVVFGDSSMEFFYNSGNVDFPFERNSGASQDIGLRARYSIQRIRNKLYFLGSDGSNDGTIYALNGYTLEPVSNNIGIGSRDLPAFSVTYPDSYSYYDGKHAIYVLYEGKYSLEGVYSIKYALDIDTGLWSIVSLVGQAGELIGTPTLSVVELFDPEELDTRSQLVSIGKDYAPVSGEPENQIIGVLGFSREIKVYEDLLTLEGIATYSSSPTRRRSLKHLSIENRDVVYKSFELDIQKAVSDIADPDPTISISMSKDGGMTYGTPKVVRIGGTNAQQRIRIKRLGRGRDVVFKIESNSPVQQEWFTAYLEYEVLDD
jgi:hypothetical protein